MNHSEAWHEFVAPCKVNLTLDVFPRRADGFHDVDSVVVRMSPSDTIRLRTQPAARPGIFLRCSDPSLPTDADNLAYRAAQVFNAGKGPIATHIDLQKNLPYQAGLGSASSDAAAVLAGLNSLHGGDTEADLLAMARTLGSDVSLFLVKGAVRMQGRGDIVQPLSVTLPVLHGVLVKPFVGVSTPEAYRLLDGMPGRRPGDATQNLLSVLQSSPNDLRAIAAALGNDFEEAILPAFPAISATFRDVLEAGAIRAVLCGSGSAVFGMTETQEQAGVMTDTLQATNRYAWVATAHSLP